ncbi:unnamed protein product [Ophioblennius macclurei]
MPSSSLQQFAEVEQMMVKHFFNLDLREPNRPLASSGLTMTAPGSGRTASSSDLSDSVILASGLWEQPSSSQSPPPPSLPPQWGKSGFPFQRSLSMVETGSAVGAGLTWPGGGGGMRISQNDISPTALGASPASSSSSSSSSRYKTELCRSFTESGLCKYGGKCQFAHGSEELRDLNRHPKYKTELCRTFHTIGFCPYGIRCHFVHNGEEESRHALSRCCSASSSSSSSSSSIPLQALSSSRPHRPPLIRQSFSFSGFPSAPQPMLAGHASSSAGAKAHAQITRAPSASPPSCADITDLLSHAFLEMDSAFEASPSYRGVQSATSAAAFLPSPDSGFSSCGLSPTGSPSLRLSPGAIITPTAATMAAAIPSSSEPIRTRSLSLASLSDPDPDQDQDASSCTSSESGLGVGGTDASGRRLAVFSQLSVPEDAHGFCL